MASEKRLDVNFTNVDGLSESDSGEDTTNDFPSLSAAASPDSAGHIRSPSRWERIRQVATKTAHRVAMKLMNEVDEEEEAAPMAPATPVSPSRMQSLKTRLQQASLAAKKRVKQAQQEASRRMDTHAEPRLAFGISATGPAVLKASLPPDLSTTPSSTNAGITGVGLDTDALDSDDDATAVPANHERSDVQPQSDVPQTQPENPVSEGTAELETNAGDLVADSGRSRSPGEIFCDNLWRCQQWSQKSRPWQLVARELEKAKSVLLYVRNGIRAVPPMLQSACRYTLLIIALQLTRVFISGTCTLLWSLVALQSHLLCASLSR